MATMPSGRDMHSLKPYIPPTLDASVLGNMRAPPSLIDDHGEGASSEDEGVVHDPVGAFPGTRAEYSGSDGYY